MAEEQLATAPTESEIIALENVSLRVQVKLLASDKEHLQVQLRTLSQQLQLYHDRERQQTAAPIVYHRTHCGNRILLFCTFSFMLGFTFAMLLIQFGSDKAADCLAIFTR